MISDNKVPAGLVNAMRAMRLESKSKSKIVVKRVPGSDGDIIMDDGGERQAAMLETIRPLI